MSDTTEGIERALVAWEEAARAALSQTWALDEIGDVWREDADGQAHLVAQRLNEDDAAHIAANDPAAVLRMVAGIRAVVALADEWERLADANEVARGRNTKVAGYYRRHATQLRAELAAMFAHAAESGESA